MVELLPLALVITVSPLSIIPGVLVMHAPHPRESSLAYLAGWSIMSGVTAVVMMGLMLSVVEASWTIVLSACVTIGSTTLAMVTYRGLLRGGARSR